MGHATKIQLIKRKKSEQWYVNLPAAIANAMEFQKGEIVEWFIEDNQRMILKRSDEIVSSMKKKLNTKP